MDVLKTVIGITTIICAILLFSHSMGMPLNDIVENIISTLVVAGILFIAIVFSSLTTDKEN